MASQLNCSIAPTLKRIAELLLPMIVDTLREQ